jgi:hypothetical protein
MTSTAGQAQGTRRELAARAGSEKAFVEMATTSLAAWPISKRRPTEPEHA